MNRSAAYKLLANRLEALRGAGFDALVPRVNQPVACETVRLNGEDVVVETVVSWADQKCCNLRVCATANGPSTWSLERLEESFVIGPNSRG
jgi:hypothetical protein